MIAVLSPISSSRVFYSVVVRLITADLVSFVNLSSPVNN